jgi:hypothetical protein
MMVLGLIARDAVNCPTYTAPAATAVPNASMDGEGLDGRISPMRDV